MGWPWLPTFLHVFTLPFIYILEEAAGCVSCGENSLVGRNSGSCRIKHGGCIHRGLAAQPSSLPRVWLPGIPPLSSDLARWPTESLSHLVIHTRDDTENH